MLEVLMNFLSRANCSALQPRSTPAYYGTADSHTAVFTHPIIHSRLENPGSIYTAVAALLVARARQAQSPSDRSKGAVCGYKSPAKSFFNIKMHIKISHLSHGIHGINDYYVIVTVLYGPRNERLSAASYPTPLHPLDQPHDMYPPMDRGLGRQGCRGTRLARMAGRALRPSARLAAWLGPLAARQA